MDRITRADQEELTALDARINALLPPIYRGRYADVSPTSMGSATVQFGPDGKVAWDKIWTTFCDLALAGGPPHRGKLLESPQPAEVEADPIRYSEVVAEIGRAVRLTTGLTAVSGFAPGWIGVLCESDAMAAWIQLAVVAENVSCRRRGCVLYFPADPRFQVKKEIKNVTAALAKACHYWDSHLSSGQQGVAETLRAWEPATPAEAAESTTDYKTVSEQILRGLAEATGLPVVVRYAGWASIETGSDDALVWLLRAVVADGVLARREETELCLPIGARPNADEAARVVRSFARAWRLWGAHCASRGA